MTVHGKAMRRLTVRHQSVYDVCPKLPTKRRHFVSSYVQEGTDGADTITDTDIVDAIIGFKIIGPTLTHLPEVKEGGNRRKPQTDTDLGVVVHHGGSSKCRTWSSNAGPCCS